MQADTLLDAGLGLHYDDLAFGVTTQAWLDAGGELRDDVAAVLGDVVAEVDVIGSSSVLGLSAKPIVDLAAGLGPAQTATR